MLKILFALSLLLASFNSLGATVIPNEKVVSSVIVRSDPNSDAGKVGSLRPGQSAEYVDSIPYYYLVRLSSGAKGYVSKRYTRLIDPREHESKELGIHFIDVGQGDSTLVKCPNGKNILIDAGSTSNADPETVREYLLAQLEGRDQTIHTLVVTHPDADHYNLLERILEDIPIQQAFWVGREEYYKSSSFREWFFKGPFKRHHLLEADYDPEGRRNPNIDCGQASFYVLAAGIISKKSWKNALSIVLMLRYGDFEAIFTGDATHATENVILERFSPAWVDVDLLKIGHHGSLDTSTSEKWAKALSPEIATVSAGDNSEYGHPRVEVINTLELYTVTKEPHPMKTGTGTRANYTFTFDNHYEEAIYSTVTSGSIEVKTSGNGWNVTASQ